MSEQWNDELDWSVRKDDAVLKTLQIQCGWIFRKDSRKKVKVAVATTTTTIIIEHYPYVRMIRATSTPKAHFFAVTNSKNNNNK